jgi:multiple sugar transport system ATP-binding protein
MARLHIENLTKIFGTWTKHQVIAVKDLTLTVNEGETVALLGPSGCGKTTTLRCIAGLEIPTSGRIYIDDEDVTDLPPSKRDIGMVFQFAVTYDNISIYENIALPLKAKKINDAEIRNRVTEVAELLGLTNILDIKPKGLDISTKQRVALARALAKEPSILLLDEPLTPLDPLSRTKLRSDIKKLQKEKKLTIVYVTHDQSEAMSLADRVAVMNKGELIQCDTPENVYINPANTFVAHFIGEPGMNFINSKLIIDQDDVFLRIGSQNLFLCRLLEFINKYGGDIERYEEVILGIRPEHIEISDKPADLEAIIELVEIHGNRSLVHLNVNDTEIIVKYPGVLVGKVNEKVWLKLQRERMVLFDKETGINLYYKNRR